jgi:microsomal dipeptidase-like Zn-dependent dipeptidase
MAFFIDAHCHPPLKHFLFGHSPVKKGHATQDSNYTNIQVTVPAMEKGGLHVVLAAHYLPEKQIKDDWKMIDASKPVKKFMEKYSDKLEREDAFAQTLLMIDAFEEEFAEADEAAVAHNMAELEQHLDRQKKVFIHTVEGAHHLGRGLSVADYSEHIAQLSAKGVAMLTLLHFYPNDVTTPTEGLPPGQKKLVGMQYISQPAPLTPVGKGIVEAILKSRIILDLTHTNHEARQEIFALNEKLGRKPMVFSHAGVRALFTDKEHPHFSLISPDDDELLQIKGCNGLIGIVFMNYFLVGKEEHPGSENDNKGLKYILSTIRHIATVTGSFDHIAIGTDFDAMSDPPDDLYAYHQFEDFSEQLYRHKDYLGATDADIEKIKGGNILRVLREVWG